MDGKRLTVAEAEQVASEWGATYAQRDEIVRTVKAAGLSKKRIHELTGIARTTIDRILKETVVTAIDIVVTLDRPADEYRSGWNWAETATDQWIAAAEKAGLSVELVSEEVQHVDSEAAIVSVCDTNYVLDVHGDTVRAVPADEA